MITLKPLARAQVQSAFQCSYQELSGLLRQRRCPLPVCIDREIVWHTDEIEDSIADVTQTLERWRRPRRS
jgi:hypothetical protein